MAQPTATEQYFLELVNRARLDPAAEAARHGIDLNQGLAPGTISTTAKQPLAWDPLLIDAARAHSRWMLDTDTFNHTGVGGSSPGDRMMAAGYVFSGSWTWGENIAIQWGGGTAIDAELVESMHAGLFKSAGHRTNIEKADFKEIGIGFGVGEYQGTTGATGTQNFARTAGSPFLTGVAFGDRDGDRFYDPGEGLAGVKVTARSSAGTVSETTTWDAGGYQMELAAGTYSVTFSGGGMAQSVTRTATVSGQNVKLDLESAAKLAETMRVVRDGAVAFEAAARYEGPATWIDWQLLGTGAGREEITGTEDADFINGLAGTDVIAGVGGDDILDGGTGSNFLTGGAGADTFFTDARGGQVGWSTIVDFLPGVEQVTVWGFRPGVTRVFWENGYGAEGFTGATAFFDMDGSSPLDRSGIDFAVTFAGQSANGLGPVHEMDGLMWFLPSA